MHDSMLPPGNITNIDELNRELRRSGLSVTGMNCGIYNVVGATPAMLDAEIADSTLVISPAITIDAVIADTKPGLITRVDSHPIEFHYDPRGDKHFPGGPEGIKFQNGEQPVVKAEVNRLIEALIEPLRGQIRRDANGKNQGYYLTAPPNQFTAGRDLVVTVDFSAAPEAIRFHGRPSADRFAYALSRTLGGPAIA